MVDEATRVSVPDSNRPNQLAAPAGFGVPEAFVFDRSEDEADIYRTPLPVHSNLFPTKTQGTHVFGSGAPQGLMVSSKLGVLPFVRGARAPNTWGFDRDSLYVAVPRDAEAPHNGGFSIRFPRATKMENSLNLAHSDLDPREFVQRTITLGVQSSTGLLLPAPGVIRWDVTLPDSATFTTRATIVPPAIRTQDTSDGAEFVLRVLDGEDELLVQRQSLQPDRWDPIRWDLGDHSGKRVTIELASEPGSEHTYDYVFAEEPTIYTPSSQPRRAVLVFVDTLRPDHLGTYGYDRPTSPAVDHWSQYGAVFEQARSVAPWTLPSARSALSGHQPEQWFEVPNVAEEFARAGFHTQAIVANAFLSQPFDMHRGWSQFGYEHLLPADAVSDAALDVFAQHSDRDVLLLVHYMDPHLPYLEGWQYRWRWAGLEPDIGMYRSRLYELSPDDPELPAIRQHAIDRYDQNIRFVDDELYRVLAAAGPDSSVILFSDHGEEFWDHGSFEHGHTFYDEVLRVPLIVRSPRIGPSRIDAPASLLDVTPTLLDLEGLPVPNGPGQSLLAAMRGDTQALEQLRARPQAFGRPLYEQDGWAVLNDGHKWIHRGGEPRLFDLGQDPGEEHNVANQQPVDGYPEAMGRAMGQDTLLVWRLKPKTRLATQGATLTLHHPEGFSDAWASYDPRGRAKDTQLVVNTDGSVTLRNPRGSEMPSSVYLLPKGNPKTPTGLTLKMVAPQQPDVEGTCELGPIEPGPNRTVLLDIGDKGWSSLIDVTWVPRPAGVAVSAFHEDLEQQLIELGYAEP